MTDNRSTAWDLLGINLIAGCRYQLSLRDPAGDLRTFEAVLPPDVFTAGGVLPDWRGFAFSAHVPPATAWVVLQALLAFHNARMPDPIEVTFRGDRPVSGLRLTHKLTLAPLAAQPPRSQE